MRGPRKSYYAVLNGRICPVICSSWAITKQLVDGFREARFKGFSTFQEATAYLGVDEHQKVTVLGGDASSELAPERSGGKAACIAVADGRHPGIYTSYKSGAEPEVVGYKHSCYKGFSTREAGEKFIQEHQEAAEMLNSARPPDAAEESGGESGKRQVDELTEDIGGMGLDDA